MQRSELVTVPSFSPHPAAGSRTSAKRVVSVCMRSDTTTKSQFFSVARIDPASGMLTATYFGNTTFQSSTSAGESHTVRGIWTTTAITADDPDPSVVGQAVPVKYKVTGNVPGGGAPSGNVTVTDGTSSCTATTDAGQCAITFATAGAKSLTATYAGDDIYAPSAPSPAVSHQVNRADTTATITSDAPDPSNLGQAVTVGFAALMRRNASVSHALRTTTR